MTTKTRAECVEELNEGWAHQNMGTALYESVISHLSADEERLKVVYGQLEEAITDTRSIIAQRDKALADLAVAVEALEDAADDYCEHGRNSELCGHLNKVDCGGCPMRAALLAAGSPPAEEWRPIESAPRDGTGILGSWRTGASGEGHSAIEVFSWASAWVPYNRKLTHWMPLPPPPAEEPT